MVFVCQNYRAASLSYLTKHQSQKVFGQENQSTVAFADGVAKQWKRSFSPILGSFIERCRGVDCGKKFVFRLVKILSFKVRHVQIVHLVVLQAFCEILLLYSAIPLKNCLEIWKTRGNDAKRRRRRSCCYCAYTLIPTLRCINFCETSCRFIHIQIAASRV